MNRGDCRASFPLHVLKIKIMEKELEINIDELIGELNGVSIVLYNDDVNTFEFVMLCLIKFCNHIPTQAEQCVHLVHNKGKCQVKSGSYTDLEPIYNALSNATLTVQIE
tara:strand:+ start:6158 stop:6484 length:327 start_codon:yes stop_codon:yes gene_type:complete